MVRVRLLTELSFSAGRLPTGTEVELPPAQAEALEALGQVERLDGPQAPEVATLDSGETGAPARPARRPRGSG